MQKIITFRCLLCQQNTHVNQIICAECHRQLPWNEACCQQCQLPTGTATPCCGNCLQAPPPWRHCHAPLQYIWPVNHLISRLKYQQQFHIPQALVPIALQYRPLPPDIDYLLPLPLHRNRLRNRGYNQAQEICRVVQRHSNIPSAHHLCKRTRNTAAQVSKTAAQRKKNVRGAFSAHPAVQGKTLCIVDDVMTTGATASELCQTLLNAGAKAVDVFVLARVPAA